MMKYAKVVVIALLTGRSVAVDAATQEPTSYATRVPDAIWRRELARRAQAAPVWRTSISKEELKSTAGYGELYSVEFLNRHIGWAVGGDADRTMVFRTADGGRRWERLPLYDGQEHVPEIRAIRFTDANNGWMAGRYHLLRTTDGGESWATVDVPQTQNGLWATALVALGPDAVLVGSLHGVVRLTTDGGQTWQQSTVGRSGEDVGALAVAPSGAVFAVAESQYSGGIYRSDDAARTWEPVVTGPKPLRALAFADDRHGVAAGDGIVYWTDDGGATWHRTMAAGRRFSVRFLDAKTVVAVGTEPGVLMSRDGGKTWRPIAGPPTQYQLTDIAAVDGGWWFVSGGYGANALFQYVDSAFVAPIATGMIPLPKRVKLPGGKVLVAGMYRVMLAYRAPDEILRLERASPLPNDSARSPSDSRDEGGGPRAPDDGFAFTEPAPGTAGPCDSCAADIPLRAEYHKEVLAPGTSPAPLHLGLEPTATGLAIVLDAAVRPPRDLAIALAALGTPAEGSVTAGDLRKAETDKKGASVIDRLKQAALGDLKGAIAGAPINPKETAERITAAKAAPPAIYRLRLRYEIELFAGRGDTSRGTGTRAANTPAPKKGDTSNSKRRGT